MDHSLVLLLRGTPIGCSCRFDVAQLVARRRSVEDWVQRGFQPTQRTQRTERKERSEITSTLRRRRMPLARCQAVADTREITAIKFDFHYELHDK